MSALGASTRVHGAGRVRRARGSDDTSSHAREIFPFHAALSQIPAEIAPKIAGFGADLAVLFRGIEQSVSFYRREPVFGDD